MNEEKSTTWINLIYTEKNSEPETFNDAKSLLYLYIHVLVDSRRIQHRDGFVHSVIAVKPESETVFSFDKLKVP